MFLCVFYTLMHGRVLHNFSNTGSHILSNASTLSSSYSAFLSVPHQITPPCIDHKLSVVKHLNRNSSLPIPSSYLIMKVRLSFYFFSKRHREEVKMKACTQLHVINLLIPHACVYSSALSRTLSCWVWLKQRNLGKLGHCLSSFKLVNDFKK